LNKNEQIVTHLHKKARTMNDKVEPPNRNEVKITHSANKPTEVPITRLHISYDVKDVKYETLVAEQSSFSGECELCGRSLQRTRITIKAVMAPFYTQPSTLVVGNCCTDVRVYIEPSTARRTVTE